ncbi:DUF695 domain-containing protein [Piscinibacter gummiphilus]|uniref:DUF695 domain-containing protein n=1 Tax=Piscinibacter gummiphilus TaxID=946333 RepID=A0ABZ0CXT4_9BURK|nr:DUF695 domain-containing protein [Piscinibacter gummiphilus]WOB07693.1 DUF695 domain-containing protein [Piscinibacter gummiphilus]
MTEHWDFYPLRVDNKPASTFVDLGIAESAPLAHLPHMAYVRLHMNDPRPDGLSSREEFDALVRVEDALQQALCNEGVGYVGRCTTNACRDFYFYIANAQGWDARVQQAMDGIDDEYEFSCGTRPDADWSVYFNFLSPGEEDRQCMENRQVCAALERHGDTLTIAREIDHWAYFSSDERMRAYVAEVATQGFQLRVARDDVEGERSHCAQVWRIDVPAYDEIDKVTLALFDAARRHDGDYDGWECPVEAEAQDRSEA